MPSRRNGDGIATKTITQFALCLLILLSAVVNGDCKAANAAAAGPIIPAKDDLICYFACNEAFNLLAVDAAQSDVQAIHSGHASSLIDAPFGKALACFGDGDEDIFRHGLDLGANDFTIAFWVNVYSYFFRSTKEREEERGLVVYGYRPKMSIFINDAGKMTLEMPYADESSMSAAAVLPRRKWTHLAFVVDRDSNEGCGIYMNGQKQPLTSVNMAASAGHVYDMDHGFMFGRSLVGHLDEFAVYAKALSAGEVKAMIGKIPEVTTPLVASHVLEEDTLPPERKPFALKAARKKAAQKERRLIFNDDGIYVHRFRTPQEFLGIRLQQIFDTHVDTVMFSAGATTMFTFDNAVGDTYGEFIYEESPTWARKLKKSISELRKTSHSTAGVALEHCRKNGIEFFLSLHMNDIHDRNLPFMRSRFKRRHPEYLSEPPKYLNYEHPEVRDHIYRIVESFCKKFDVDGIELNWMRDPQAFPPSWRGKSIGPWRVELMNNLMRRIRIMTERIGEERGRPILLAVRTPASVDRALFCGFDLQTWIEEDLVDILAVGVGFAPMAIVSTVREIVDLAHQHGVTVHSVVSPTSMYENRWYGTGHDYYTAEVWRAVAMNIWHAGGDGVNTGNFLPSREERDRHIYQILNQIGSAETLKGLDKIYCIDRLPIGKFYRNKKWALVAPDRLPITLQKDVWTPAKLPVGEDISANTPPGKTCTARLRLKLSSLAEGDNVMIRLNGNELGDAMHQPGAWVTLDADPRMVKEGYNIVEVKLSPRLTLADMPVIDRLDLTVRYK